MQLTSAEHIAFTDLLLSRTAELHRRAERAGAVADILRGRADVATYGLYLRNLLPAYEQLEHGLLAHADEKPFRRIALPALFRSDAITSDLQNLFGADWPTRLPVLPATLAYASRLSDAAEKTGSRLVAHAYVRYMGDLSGGQILKRLLMKRLRLSPSCLTFYDFKDIGEIDQFRRTYRDAIGATALSFQDQSEILEEACLAFEHNIDVSVAVQKFSEAPSAGFQ